jgi:hypothetical protein
MLNCIWHIISFPAVAKLDILKKIKIIIGGWRRGGGKILSCSFREVK